MPNYNGDGTDTLNMFSLNNANNSNSLDWLNSGLNSLGNTALKGYDTYYKVKSISNTAKDNEQKSYQNKTQAAVGSKNLIKGIDNNFILLSIAAILAIVMIKGG